MLLGAHSLAHSLARLLPNLWERDWSMSRTCQIPKDSTQSGLDQWTHERTDVWTGQTDRPPQRDATTHPKLMTRENKQKNPSLSEYCARVMMLHSNI